MHFLPQFSSFFFFFNDTATTEIYTLSLHDALPISEAEHQREQLRYRDADRARHLHVVDAGADHGPQPRSEEHTSELQSRPHLVCRLLLEKKKKQYTHQSKIKVIRRRPNVRRSNAQA